MFKQTLRSDLEASLRAKNTIRTGTLRLLLSAIQYAEMQKGRVGYEASDEEIVDVIQKEVKKRKEAIELYTKGNREDLVKKETEELTILQGYLPKQLSEEEIQRIVMESIKQVEAKSPADIGRVMGALMPKIKGIADGTMVSKLVREQLQ